MPDRRGAALGTAEVEGEADPVVVEQVVGFANALVEQRLLQPVPVRLLAGAGHLQRQPIDFDVMFLHDYTPAVVHRHHRTLQPSRLAPHQIMSGGRPTHMTAAQFARLAGAPARA